jgi:hypothetical protein
MVEITLWIEGGILPPQNSESTTRDPALAATLDNAANLRESFKKLFRPVIDEEKFRFIPQLGAGKNSTAKLFKLSLDKPHALFLRDLDSNPLQREACIAQICIYLEIADTVLQDKIFFMVQEMEAWILSQPDIIPEAIEKTFSGIKTNVDFQQAYTKLLRGKSISLVSHPNMILRTLLKQTFVIVKSKKTKKLEYGKLRHSPSLIELLSIEKLIDDFEDVRALVNRMLELSV